MTQGSGSLPPAGDIDEFRLLRVLGRGGMGAVYLAHDTVLDRAVALKLMRGGASEEHRLRFLTEARALARVHHPNVVSIYRAGISSKGEPYLVQELVGGTSIDRSALPVPPRRALELAIGITRGLATAHRRGVLHRDIKPSNIMVDEAGTPRLLDFGLAKLTGAAQAPPFAPEATAATADRSAELGATSPATRRAAQALDATAERPAALDATTERPAALDATAERPALALHLSATLDGRADLGCQADEPRSAAYDLADGSGAADTSAGTILGTPRYMAPEVWTGASASARSDLYSLGVVLYELLTGAPPHPQTEREALRHAVVDGPPPPPLVERVPDLPTDLSALVTRCLERDPAARPESADSVLYELERIAAGAPPIPEGSPYRGLAPFEAEQRALFFGRGADIAAIVDRLRSEPVVVVAGDSGIGKSSLCRAGVLPAIAAGALADGRTWTPIVLVPGPTPSAALAAALDWQLPQGELPPPAELAQELARRTSPERGRVLLLDQAEELVTLSGTREAERASTILAALAEGLPGVRLLVAVRGDFLTRVAALPALRGALTRSLHLVRGLSPEDARAVVIEPARAKGVRFESEELIADLVSSILERPAALPLLQFALAELWSHRDLARAVIPARALAEIGGVAGALASHADRVITALGAPERAAARRVLVALVSAEGTRIGRGRSELVAGDDGAAALEALVRRRLVAARDVADGEPRYELAHESLLSAWGTLRSWLDDLAGERGVRARLGASAEEWDRLGRRRELLWKRSQLAEAARLAELPPREHAFLRASRRAHRLRLSLAVALAAAVPAVAGLTWWSVSTREHARRVAAVERRRAAAEEAMRTAGAELAQASRLRAEAVALFRGAAAPKLTAPIPELAEALRQHYEKEEQTRNQRWAHAERRFGEARAAMREAARQLEGALGLGANRQAVARQLADVVAAELALADQVGDDAALADLEPRLAEYDDGPRLERWLRPVPVTVRAPGAEHIALSRYLPGEDGRLLEQPIATEPGGTLAVRLAPGSYRAAIVRAGQDPVAAPFLVRRDAPLSLEVPLPTPGTVPPGFVFIPPGTFLHGLDDHREPDLTWVRQNFFRAPPLHEETLPAYLIGRHEVTFGDYLRFLRTLPADELARRRQSGDPATERSVRLDGDGRGPFSLTLRPLGVAYSAQEGEPMIFSGRRHRQRVRWEDTPVVGIDRSDAEAYAAWLSTSGQVPGARLCTPLEWERAARGADGRRFPHGDALAAHEANIDLTYRRDAMSPDPVGSYPASVSPFGLYDLAGNAYEMVANGWELSMRGGSWWSGPTSAATMNVTSIQATRRDVYIGVRLCASWPAATAPARRSR